jgi:hypothetical protein
VSTIPPGGDVQVSKKINKIEYDEFLPDDILFAHIIDRQGGKYRLSSRHSDSEMKHTGNFDDLESTKACADLLDLSKIKCWLLFTELNNPPTVCHTAGKAV